MQRADKQGIMTPGNVSETALHLFCGRMTSQTADSGKHCVGHQCALLLVHVHASTAVILAQSVQSIGSDRYDINIRQHI